MKKIIIVFLSFYAVINAQSFSGGFNFNLPFDDTTSASFLPSFPVQAINDNEFISVNSEGNFALNGNAIRFWGGNLVSGAAFADTNKAWFIAGRLRKMGFNLIRFHHIDNPWGNESLFEYGSGKNTRHLNPVTLDRMEKLIYRLKQNGVYINMNLNVSRTFKTIDGVQYADSLVEFAKGITQFDPQLIELQKEYAQQLLTHVNPYTSLPLVNDPVMAMVEVANENSLYRVWRDANLKSFADGGWLLNRHVRMLDSAWNKFLTDKYSITSALEQSWSEGLSEETSPNQVKNGTFESGSVGTSWEFEQHEGTSASISKETALPYEGTGSAKITANVVTGTAWHLQWKQIGLKINEDSSYTVEFAARADGNKTITVVVMRNNDPYTYYSGQDFLLTNEWKIYSFSFKGTETNNGQTRLSFEFGQTGQFWFDNISLAKPKISGLLAGESLENKNVKRIDFSESIKFSNNRVKDISDFYITLQKNYFAAMKDYLVNTLGVKVPIVGTNWNAGAADLSVQSEMDYIDNHSYWEHPSFPNVPWSSTDWYINNTAMVRSDGGTIPDLFAGVPMAGKPFTISEYNHPFPNRYQVEAPLMISAYSAFHGADGIMFFEYNSENSWQTDKVNNFFSIHRNNVLMSLMPSCAFAYRYGYIARAKETILINYSDETIKLMPKDDPGGWMSYSPYSKKLALQHGVRTESFNSAAATDFASLPAEPVNPYKTDTDEITYDTGGLFTVNAPKFIGLAGYLNQHANTHLGSLKLISSNDFGTITWISLTDDSLKSSEKSLLTISSKIQNTNMIWDGNTTIHNNWGSAPTQIFPLQASLELGISADSIHIYPLDTRGQENAGYYIPYYQDAEGKFTITLNQNTYKTEWFGIEKFGVGIPTSVEESENTPSDFKLEQNYPNPFNNSTRINYSVPFNSKVLIEVYNILGNKIKTLMNEEKSAGNFSVSWNGMDDSNKSISSGVYFVKLTAQNFTSTKKLVLLK